MSQLSRAYVYKDEEGSIFFGYAKEKQEASFLSTKSKYQKILHRIPAPLLYFSKDLSGFPLFSTIH